MSVISQRGRVFIQILNTQFKELKMWLRMC